MLLDRFVRQLLNGSVLFAVLLVSTHQAACAESENKSTRFFLPQNPTAAAYVLSRLSDQELINAPRGEFVYLALLQRSGLPSKYRLEALDGLAGLRHSDRLTQSLLALGELDKKGDAATNALHDLAGIVLQFKPSELSTNGPGLAKIASDSQMPIARQIGWAARILAGASVDETWREANAAPGRLLDLLAAIPLLPQPEVRGQFYESIKALLGSSLTPPALQAAAMALASVPARESDSFTLLAGLVHGTDETPGLLMALQRISPGHWPNDRLPALADAVMQYLNRVPADARSGPEFASALQFETELASHLPSDAAKPLIKTLRGLGPTLLSLRAIYEQMRFDKEHLVVEAGKPVIITLNNEDAMPHNLALLAPGALKEIGTAAEKMPATPDAQGRLYVPDSAKVLAATRLVPPGQKLQLSFTAPSEPNDYPYVCTFPGHWLRMSGVLTVVADLEAYLASHPASEPPKLTEWKISDFGPDLAHGAQGGNLAAGKELFSKLACAQCHRLGGEGYAYGPELTDVFQRYTNNPIAVLQQILEPSLRVEPRYRNVNFELNDAEPVTGMILKEDDGTVTVQTGPADSLIQVLKKSDVKSRRDQPSSPMPVGLLNALSKSQILDLVSLLEAGGKVSSPQHHHAANSEEPH